MKTYIITGGNSGLGFETAKNLAKAGHRIILACRNLEKGEAAAKAIQTHTEHKYIDQTIGSCFFNVSSLLCRYSQFY